MQKLFFYRRTTVFFYS